MAALWGCQKADIIKPQEKAVTGIILDQTSATMYVGDKLELKATVEPADAPLPKLVWSSTKEAVITVDNNGIVKAVAAGDGRIRVETEDYKFSTVCKIKVLEKVAPKVSVTGVKLDAESKELKVGEKFTLTATVTPDNADVKDINWKSSNTSIATVTDGEVAAVGAGQATITVTTLDGNFTATCAVTVTKETGGGGGGGEDDPPSSDRVRWADTGADVPAYPSYNQVSSYADFPRLDISVSGSIKKDQYKTATFRFRDPKGMYCDVTDTGELAGEVRGRGNSSWDYAEGNKKPYRIKLSTKSKVFGMGSDRDWILLADSMDPSQLRNEIAQRMARVISMDFAPRFRTVELYINGSYAGSYTLMEHKETGLGHKVFVDPVDPSSTVTDGGYYVELDLKGDDAVQFTSSTFGRLFNFKDPEQPNSAQKAYFMQLINDTESAMKSKNWEKVHELIEMDTWIQNYIVQELSMNVDGNMRLSTYFAKDKDTKLYMPMVWDFDLAFGNAGYIVNFCGTKGPEGWFIKNCGGGQENPYEKTYYQYLFQDPAFVSRLKELWNKYYPRLEAIGTQYIDKMAQYNAPAFQHSVDEGHNSRVTYWGADNETWFSSYEDAISYVKNFYNKRLTWLNTQINNL